MKLTVLITLSKPISLKPNCLNKSINLDFNEYEGQLLTPSLPPNFQDNKESYNKKPLIEPSNEYNFPYQIEWGQPYSWPNGDSWVSKFIIEIELIQTRLTKVTRDKLQSLIENWLNAFEENLFAIEYNIILPTISIEYDNSSKVNLFRKLQNRKMDDLEKNPSHNISISRPKSIDFLDFKYICKKTSEKKTLTLSFSFLKESQIAISNKEYRKAILNCATAFEIALTNYLRNNLPINNADILKEVLKQNNSIRKKRDLLRKLKFALPNYNYQHHVEEIRNSAIHAGTSVDKPQANLAHKIVAEALEVLIVNKLE